MRKFFIRTKSIEGCATLYVRIRKRNPDVNIYVSSRIQVDVPTWEKANLSIASWNRFLKTKAGMEVHRKMMDVDAAISFLTGQGVFDKDAIDEAVTNAVFREEREELKAVEDEARRKEEELEKKRIQEEEERKADVILFLKGYLDGIKDGSIKYNGETYGKNTCKVWSNFLGILSRFHSENPFSWSDINKTLTDRFLCFMESEGYMIKSINKYLICFRAMVGYAMTQGIHDNAAALRAFSKRKVSESDKAREIYLTGTELQALYQMRLDGLQETVRDVFLVRVSSL